MCCVVLLWVIVFLVRVVVVVVCVLVVVVVCVCVGCVLVVGLWFVVSSSLASPRCLPGAMSLYLYERATPSVPRDFAGTRGRNLPRCPTMRSLRQATTTLGRTGGGADADGVRAAVHAGVPPTSGFHPPAAHRCGVGTRLVRRRPRRRRPRRQSRKKLDDNPGQPRFLRTVRGVGYTMGPG